MKPWYEILDVDEGASWRIIENAYLSKWRPLKAKGMPNAEELEQIKTLEEAFRQAKEQARLNQSGLSDASDTDGNKPKSKQVENVGHEENMAEKRAEYGAYKKKPKEEINYGSSIAIAAAVIASLALLIMLGLLFDIGMDVMGLIIVFLLPAAYFALPVLKKPSWGLGFKTLGNTEKIGLVLLWGFSALILFSIGMISKINVFILLCIHLLSIGISFGAPGKQFKHLVIKQSPSLLLSLILLLNYLIPVGEPIYEQHFLKDKLIPKGNNAIRFENDAYQNLPGLRIYFDNEMYMANQLIFEFRTGVFGIEFRQAYYPVPFSLEKEASNPDPRKNIQIINEYRFRQELAKEPRLVIKTDSTSILIPEKEIKKVLNQD